MVATSIGLPSTLRPTMRQGEFATLVSGGFCVVAQLASNAGANRTMKIAKIRFRVDMPRMPELCEQRGEGLIIADDTEVW